MLSIKVSGCSVETCAQPSPWNATPHWPWLGYQSRNHHARACVVWGPTLPPSLADSVHDPFEQQDEKNDSDDSYQNLSTWRIHVGIWVNIQGLVQLDWALAMNMDYISVGLSQLNDTLDMCDILSYTYKKSSVLHGVIPNIT